MENSQALSGSLCDVESVKFRDFGIKESIQNTSLRAQAWPDLTSEQEKESVSDHPALKGGRTITSLRWSY